MLQRVNVTNANGQYISFPLGGDNDGIILTQIEGLDPVHASLVFTKLAKHDGSLYHSGRRESRNILMGFRLDSRYTGGEDVVIGPGIMEPTAVTSRITTREMRNKLYRFFMPKSEVRLQFLLDDGFLVETKGIVESLDSPMFQQTPTAVVSIICPNPDFENPVKIEGFGEATGSFTEKYINYLGTTPTGLTFTLNVDQSGPIRNFAIHHRTILQESRSLNFDIAFQGGERITIETTPGRRSASSIRNSNYRNVLYGVSPDSFWPLLIPGENWIAVTVNGPQSSWSYEYTNKYGGI